MDKSSHFDISVLVGIIKHGATRAKESSEQCDGNNPNPPSNLSLPDLLVVIGKEALRLLASIGGTVVGGLLPDILEPPSTPNHRSLMHSLLAGAITATIVKKSEPIRNSLEGGFTGQLLSDFLTSLPIGYLTHLLCDATTSKGLPVIL